MEKVQSSCVCDDNDPEAALRLFMNYFNENCEWSCRKCTTKAKKALWIDIELKDLMTLRDNAKKMANNLCCPLARQEYCKLRNHMTK